MFLNRTRRNVTHFSYNLFQPGSKPQLIKSSHGRHKETHGNKVVGSKGASRSPVSQQKIPARYGRLIPQVELIGFFSSPSGTTVVEKEPRNRCFRVVREITRIAKFPCSVPESPRRRPLVPHPSHLRFDSSPILFFSARGISIDLSVAFSVKFLALSGNTRTRSSKWMASRLH